MSKFRNFSFTWNNYTENDLLALNDVECSYLCFGKEIGESGTKHLQGYLVFKNQRSEKSIFKMFKGWHVEVARGTAIDNKTYCSKGNQPKSEWDDLKEKGPNYGKDADVYERGVIPMSSAGKGDAERARWTDSIKAVAERRWDSVDPQLLVSHGHGLEYAASKLYKRKFDDLREPLQEENEWHWGDPASGKSMAIRRDPGFYTKMPGRWWDGYEDEEIVVIDDVHFGRDGFDFNTFYNWVDKFEFRAEVKGGSMMIRPRKIRVSAQFQIHEYVKDPVRAVAMQRRFKEVHHVHDPFFSECLGDRGGGAIHQG